ncbi:MAG: hypothetical protein AAFZ07_15305 [Actinomycetota bacterium]
MLDDDFVELDDESDEPELLSLPLDEEELPESPLPPEEPPLELDELEARLSVL